MACRFTELIIDARDPGAQARFWAQALGWRFDGDEKLPALIPPDPAIPLIVFVPVPEDKSVKNRLHIDIHSGPDGLEALTARLETLGATRVERWVHTTSPRIVDGLSFWSSAEVTSVAVTPFTSSGSVAMTS